MNKLPIKNGFTIIEVVIVLAVIAVVSIVSLPMGIQFFNGQNIESIQSQFADTLNRARSQSMSQKGDAQYGVCIINSAPYTSSYVLFMGTYSACSTLALAGENEVYPLLDGIQIEYPDPLIDNISFAKHTGLPSATGTIAISWNGIQRTISIDSFGTIVEQ
jgi:prepilin-type N-terminal cleavage/methylation domain-containing protein